MSRRFYNLPPLTALAALEAAARHQSFKLAAEELNVTPGAVSHQIRALEDELGVKLFQRVHRGVELTDDGERLFRVVRGAFLDISAQTDSLRQKDHKDSVTVGATTAMSALWLTPAVSRFWRDHPGLRVNQIVSDLLDFGLATPELVISYGPYREAHYQGTTLFRDTLIPVMSSALAKHHQPRTIEELAAMPLVHLDAPDQRWTTWAHWFGEFGYGGALRRGIVVNNYMIALQAAQDGVGMVLGWKRLVARYLKSGALVGLHQFSLPAPTSFFVSRHDRTASDHDLDALQDWVVAVANGN